MNQMSSLLLPEDWPNQRMEPIGGSRSAGSALLSHGGCLPWLMLPVGLICASATGGELAKQGRIA